MVQSRNSWHGVRHAVALLVIFLSVADQASSAQVPAPKAHRSLPSAEELEKLPADGRPDFNRLVFEHSPYLLQHATNPVDWFPWGEAAFAKARAEEKLVFLSIGYSTCHWCHVMERESFEDAEVAALLNKDFVAIKVDREERPDVDQLYMEATQAMTGTGGWPMTVVMTPDKRPFFAGTYFPKRGVHGRAGLVDILAYLAEAWKTQRDTVIREGDKVVEAIRAQVASEEAGQSGELGPSTLDRAYQELSRSFDPEEGGFGSAPKFPIPHQLRFLLRVAQRTGDARALEMVERTLQALAQGGIRDHVGFGFHRYSTDRQWLVPHFEKMLYDQALIAMAYVEAYLVTHKTEYRDVARETIEYVLRDLRAPEGGFYCAEDADSAGLEGIFYTWTYGELARVLGASDAELFAEAYGVPAPSGARAGKPDQPDALAAAPSILHLTSTWPALAAKRGLSEADLRARIESLRAKLFEAREKRVRPARDDKILTDWNGLMIAALAQAARAFDEPRYATAARRAAEFVLTRMRDGEGRLHKRYRRGSTGLPAAVDDYAFFISGLIELYETDFDARWLEQALLLERGFSVAFWDEKNGGYFFTPKDGEVLFARTKAFDDGALPSGNSVAAWNLLMLARLTGDPEHEARAERIFKASSKAIGERPSAAAQMMIALELASGPSLEVVIAGAPEASDVQAMIRALRARFLPQAALLLRPDGTAGDDPPIARIAPFTKDQKSVGGRATAYVCRNFACEKPILDVEALLRSVVTRAAPSTKPAGPTPDAPQKLDKP